MSEIDHIYFIEDEDFFCLSLQYAENINKTKENSTLSFVDSSVGTDIIDDRYDRWKR